MFDSQWLLALPLSLSSLAAAVNLPQQEARLQFDPHPHPHPHPDLSLSLSLTHDLIGFHKNLVDIESISGNEKAVGDWLTASLVDQGYHVEKQYLSKAPERFNVYAWPGHNRDAPVVLSSHIDTVSASMVLIRTPTDHAKGPPVLALQVQ